MDLYGSKVFWLTFVVCFRFFIFFFQAEDGIRDLVRSRGLGDVYKRQVVKISDADPSGSRGFVIIEIPARNYSQFMAGIRGCLLYTSDAADDLLCVDLGGRRIIKKKN